MVVSLPPAKRTVTARHTMTVCVSAAAPRAHDDAPAAQPARASSSQRAQSSRKGVISPSKGGGSSMTPSTSETIVFQKPSGCCRA